MSPWAAERVELPVDDAPERWYNALPDLPRLPDPYLDPDTGEPVSGEYMERLLPKSLVAQEASLERWITIPEPVQAAYRAWRPTPLCRARALEEHLATPAEIYFKFEASSPSGSHKLNSALAQAYFAKQEGVKCLVTETGAGQWGIALALAGALMGIEVVVYMVRASYEEKPYRRIMMETLGATVYPSPGPHTEYGRGLLAENPDHPGSEGTAVTEALQAVRQDDGARYATGAFANHVLLHQTVIGLEARAQLDLIDREPDVLIASVGCGSNFGGLTLPWLTDRLREGRPRLLAAEPTACATLSEGEYRYDLADARGQAPAARTYTLGHEFIPPPIHAGGLRYHGAAPIVGMMRHEGLVDVAAYAQDTVFDAARLFVRLHGWLPAPETAHAIRAAIDVAQECKEQGRSDVIVIGFSGHGLLDLGAYERVALGAEADELARALAAEPAAGLGSYA